MYSLACGGHPRCGGEAALVPHPTRWCQLEDQLGARAGGGGGAARSSWSTATARLVARMGADARGG
eukprot:12907368-Prorocentrum_lima.AAC.1